MGPPPIIITFRGVVAVMMDGSWRGNDWMVGVKGWRCGSEGENERDISPRR